MWESGVCRSSWKASSVERLLSHIRTCEVADLARECDTKLAALPRELQIENATQEDTSTARVPRNVAGVRRSRSGFSPCIRLTPCVLKRAGGASGSRRASAPHVLFLHPPVDDTRPAGRVGLPQPESDDTSYLGSRTTDVGRRRSPPHENRRFTSHTHGTGKQ